MARRHSSVFLTLLGIALLLAAGGMVASSYHFRITSLRATGRITRLIRAHGSGCPMFVFSDGAGKEYTVQSHTSGPIQIYQVGETVSVLYQRGDPYDAKIDDWVNLWMAPMGLGFFGMLALMAAQGAPRRRDKKSIERLSGD